MASLIEELEERVIECKAAWCAHLDTCQDCERYIDGFCEDGARFLYDLVTAMKARDAECGT